MKKVLFYFLFSLVFFVKGMAQDNFQWAIVNGYTDTKVGMLYGKFGIVYGNATKITLIEYSKIGAFNSLYLTQPMHQFLNDTLIINSKGQIIKHRESSWEKNRYYQSKYFDQYDTSEQKKLPIIDTSTLIFVDHFNVQGNIVQIDCNSKSGKVLYKTYLNYGRNWLTEFTVRDAENNIKLRQSYYYNKSGFLSEVNDFGGNNLLIEKVKIVYSKFDKKNNWRNKIETRQTGLGTITGRIITVRKIEY